MKISNLLSISDLVENKEYYATLSKGGKVKKIRVLGVVKSYSKPEIFFQVLYKNKPYPLYSIFLYNEIGIGLTKEDAIVNYGKLIDDNTPVRYYSDDELEKHLKKIQTSYNKFDYFNARTFNS